jgi:hypothetical protein
MAQFYLDAVAMLIDSDGRQMTFGTCQYLGRRLDCGRGYAAGV